MTSDNKRVLAVGAHPDDVECLCAGTLFLLREAGYEICIATMAAGDCGSATLSPQEISCIRRGEAEAAAKLLGATYRHVGFNDCSFYSDDASNRRTTALLREIDPLVVLTHSPQDYMSDHEIVSLLVRNACFYAPAPNYDTRSFTQVARSSAIPYLYYFESMEGIDIFGDPIKQHFYIDISPTMEAKLEMLGCHQSQRAWLQAHHGMDDYLESTRRRSRDAAGRALAAGGRAVACAEGFRQHRGHAYPRENFLAQALPHCLIS